MDKNKLTDNELDSIVEVLSEERDNYEDNKISYNIDETVTEDVIPVTIYTDIIPDMQDIVFPSINNGSKNIDADVDLFDISKDMDLSSSEDNIDTDLLDSVSNSMDGLEEEDICKLMEVITKLQQDPDYKPYNDSPDFIKNIVNDIMKNSSAPISEKNNITKMVLSEFIKDDAVENILIDLQKTIDEALNIPSISDMYTEHTRYIMEVKFPEMIEAIKDETPEKAELLRQIQESFTNSYNFSFAKKEYENNSRLRKFIRTRYEKEYERSLSDFNFKNDKSNFKMNDVRELPVILANQLIDEPNFIKSSGLELEDRISKILDMNIDLKDIYKFCILITRSCQNLDVHNIVDACYMYYMMKNIIVLKLTQEAKTDFAAELISNICDTIAFIRNKEEEFYGENKSV